MFERLIPLIGEDNLKKIQNTKILLIGIGGVGGFTLEALARSGFEQITIIDGDIIDVTFDDFGNKKLLGSHKALSKIED